MANTQGSILGIIAEARDKYTVHDCTECNWRKCCLLNARGFGSAECLEKRERIALALGIEDGYFQGLLDRLEAAWKRERDRNCDRFVTAEEAWNAYDEWVESCRAKGQTPAFNEFGWLFAAAAEKEGGAK